MQIGAQPWRSGLWHVQIIVRNGRSEVADFIDGLPIRIQQKLTVLVERIAESQNGPFDIRNDQKFKRLEENLYELKADYVRLLCFLHGNRVIIVTNGFLKKTRRAPSQELARARTLRRLYQEAQSR
ncbi:MAG: type II toxin-antitoxin system RelE/ParE family toxin [Chloroflexi bacterium]|nr:type II toxin-antitoxin system RelE/ParE family toxin [Chloroflexota bacterium]